MTPPSLEAPGVALTADFRWKLLDLEDKPVELAKFRGRPILLNLWFTECGPCLEEMPTIANLAANPRLKDKVVFLCVSTDESTAKVREFLKDKTWGMTFLRIDSLPPPVFLTDGMPATFVIAPDGRIVTGEVGAAKWDDPPVVDFLEKLAKTAH
jgi:thiol-disulfide isomerase/thioredoxin